VAYAFLLWPLHVKQTLGSDQDSFPFAVREQITVHLISMMLGGGGINRSENLTKHSTIRVSANQVLNHYRRGVELVANRYNVGKRWSIQY
jgi:hypothetical protein